MLLLITEKNNKQVCSIELSFDGEFKEQLINKRQFYYYKWSNKSITISKLIATFDVDVIEQQALELLAECRRFKFMYCI